MVFVDTSVWIEFFKGKSEDLVLSVNHLLDQKEVALSAPVWLEILNGTPRKSQKILNELLSALPIFYTTEEIWQRAGEWSLVASTKGERFSSIDLLIASVATDQNATIWSLDKDFKRMEKLNFVSLYPILH